MVDALCNPERATLAAFRAYINWREFEGAWENALSHFKDTGNQKRFVSRYGVLQGESGAARTAIWAHLLKDGSRIFTDMDESGVAIDRLAEELRNLPDVAKRHVSFCSKLAAFAKPESFVATDSYNRRGLLRAGLIDRNQATNPASYVDLLTATMKARDRFHDVIATAIRKHNIVTPPRVAFELRVLDCYLMGLGGFEDKRSGNPPV
jgi:hypothetical protein